MMKDIAALNVSRETQERLDAYAGLLLRWNKSINLISRNTEPDIQARHILDSAQILELAPPDAQTWTDLGSGGGLPGCVIAILAAERFPKLKLRLVESDGRKCAFLRTVARELGLDMIVDERRIEGGDTQPSDIVSARALAPLPVLLGYVTDWIKPDGVALLHKGSGAEAELTAAAEDWRYTVEQRPSTTDPDARILIFREISRAIDEG